MNPEDIKVASYRGAEFFVTSGSIAGGRKTARKEFVDSDLQVVEDLGLRQREFTISGTVAARRSNDGAVIRTYQQVRDELLDALELGGVGVLVHPFLGKGSFDNIVVIEYSLSESTTRLGDSPIEITFAVSNTDGRPIAQENSLATVTSGVSAATAQIGTDIADRFSVTDSFTGNFQDALDKVDAFLDAVEAATSVSNANPTKVDAFNNEVDKFRTNKASNVDTPATLSASSTDLFSTINGLYLNTQDTFDAMVRLFTFGDDDATIQQTTAGLIERQLNRDVLNQDWQGLALAYAYENGVQLSFPTVEDIDATALVLEDQYQKQVDSGKLDSNVEEELTKLRITANDFFDQQRDVRPRILTVRTNPTSARLLAYQYYGESDLGETIAELNGLDDSAFIEGDVKILSEV